MNRVFRKSGAFAALLFTSGLAGCAGTDVELNGGIFDLVGFNNIGKKQAEPELTQRSSLVVPPSTASLPTPGSSAQQPTAVAANGEAWPVDPEKKDAQQTAALQAQHKEFCEKARHRYETGLSSTLEQGPLGSCEESILRNFTGKGLFENSLTDQSQSEPN